MQKFNTVDELVNTIKPADPVYCIRPSSIKLASSWFKNKFPGKVLYAVKTNPDTNVIKYIGESGIEKFDVASINEIKLIPVKKNRENKKFLIISSKTKLGQLVFVFFL